MIPFEPQHPYTALKLPLRWNNGIQLQMILPYHLGLDHEVGIDFLSMTGLVRKVNRGNLHCTVVVQAEWANIVVEQHLSEILDTVNKPVVSQSRFFFKPLTN
jgi:hypothetical protein